MRRAWNHRCWGLLCLSLWRLAAGAAGAPDPWVFQLDWRPNAQFAGLLIAQHRGWFRDAGLEVHILPVDPGMQVVDRVLAGSEWLGCADTGVLLPAAARGAPIKILGVMLQGSPMALISLKGGGYTTIGSLVGKRLGIHPDGQKALELVFRHEHFNRAQFQITEQPGDLTSALGRQFDAVQAYLIDEAVEMETQGRAIDAIPLHAHGYVAYSQVYFTSVRTWETHRPELQRLLDAANRGWLAAAVATDAAADTVVDHFAPQLNRNYQHHSLDQVIQLSVLESGLDGLGTLQPQTLAAAARALQAEGIIHQRFGTDAIADFSMMKPHRWTESELNATRDWREPTGEYPRAPGHDRPGPGRLWVEVAGDGKPTRVLVATPSGPDDPRDTEWVANHWRWPVGSRRRFVVPLPLR